MNRICRLTEQIFPELNQLVTLNIYGIPGHMLPVTVDFVGAFNYNIGHPDKTYAQVMSDIETVVSAIRNAGVIQPMLWIAQAAHGPPDDTRRMPTPEEMKWQYQACVELNRTQPGMNLIGLQWWQLENTGGRMGIAEDYFSTYAGQIQAHREIGRDAGFATNTYTFVDLFETVPIPAMATLMGVRLTASTAGCAITSEKMGFGITGRESTKLPLMPCSKGCAPVAPWGTL